MTDKPNVLFLVVDSLRYDAVLGDDSFETPALEKLAEDGVIFNSCFSQGISTAPSMTSMLTGRYPLDYGGHRFISDEQATFAREFKDRGYTTAGIHSNPHLSRTRNYDKGFDHFNESILPIEPTGPFEKLPHKAILFGTKVARILSRTPYLPAPKMNELVTDVVDKSEQPWFIWGQYMDVHGPYLPGGDISYRNKFRAEKLWQKAAVKSPESVTESEHKELYTNYGKEVEYLDSQIGQLLNSLEERNQLNNTVIIVAGDHGDEFREHGQYSHGNLPYDELIHVPLLMQFPDEMSVDQPAVVGEWNRCLDILPTVLDIIPGEYSSTMGKQIEGESLIPVINNDEQLTFPHIVTEKEMLGKDDLRISFRTKEWKYMFDGEEDEEHLYNLKKDPEETEDVSANHPEVMDEFQSDLQDRFDKIENTSENIAIPDIEDSAGVNERLRALGYKE